MMNRFGKVKYSALGVNKDRVENKDSCKQLDEFMCSKSNPFKSRIREDIPISCSSEEFMNTNFRNQEGISLSEYMQTPELEQLIDRPGDKRSSKQCEEFVHPHKKPNLLKSSHLSSSFRNPNCPNPNKRDYLPSSNRQFKSPEMQRLLSKEEEIEGVRPIHRTTKVMNNLCEQFKTFKMNENALKKDKLKHFRQDSMGYTPLMCSIILHNREQTSHIIFEAQEYFCTSMLNVKTHDFGQTALHFAVRMGQLETVRNLLVAGASPSISDQMGFTPLHVCVKSNNLDIFKVFLKHVSPNKMRDMLRMLTNEGDTILHLAARYGSVSLIEHILEDGKVSVNIIGHKTHETILHVAVETSNLCLLTFLCKRYDTDIHAKTKTGNTALALANAYNLKPCQLILEKCHENK